MSLLGSQVYANPSTPLWLSTAGGNITGGLTVDGTIETLYGGAFVTQDISGNSAIRITGGATPNVGYIQTNDAIVFSQVGQGSGNSSLQVKAVGSNDILTVGGFCDAYRLGTTSTNQPDSSAGTATLSNGIVTVNTTASDVTAQIMVTRTAINGSTALGHLRVSNQGANDFTVTSATYNNPTSTETNDQSSFAWFILNGA